MTFSQLRRHALANTFFKPTSLRRAITKLGFVQADPIRSPARAQDLILRHRVTGYHAGELEERYPSLHLEEDFVYAYGFMPSSTWNLLHPRISKDLTGAEERVLEIVATHRKVHPRQLEQYLGREREINAWGGYSKATTRVLQALQYRGLLRVVGRDRGVRLYEAVRKPPNVADPEERLQRLAILMARILSPVPERSLRAALRLLGYGAPSLPGRRSVVDVLIRSGQLLVHEVEGVRFVRPPGPLARRPPAEMVRFLAPFDPLVWDRYRFELFWKWSYRFEAYTPPSKRKLGYYAMPLLWLEDIVGWVTISHRSGRLAVKTGFAKTKPTEPAFKREFENEVERFREFLLPSTA